MEDRDPPAAAAAAAAAGGAGAGAAPSVRRTPAGDGAAETPTAGKVGFRLCACGSLRDSGPLRTGTDWDSVPHGAHFSLRGAAQRFPAR